MPRPLRAAAGEIVYHVLNRANARRPIFQQETDYVAFENTLAEAQKRVSMRILAWCLMPNHWHLVLWPRLDGELSEYMRLVTLMHTQRWHAHRSSTGTGHLYQGRFKSFAVQHDAHFLTVCRYVEANALRGGLVRRAEDWRWSSLWRSCTGNSDKEPRIDAWPVARPSDWLVYVNDMPTATEVDALRTCARRGAPYGSAPWQQRVVRDLKLEGTLRPRGRPKKGSDPFFGSESGGKGV